MYISQTSLTLLSLMLMSSIVSSSCIRNPSILSADPPKQFQFPIAAEQVIGLRCSNIKTDMSVIIQPEDMKSILAAINRSAKEFFRPQAARAGRPPSLFLPFWQLKISTQDGQLLMIDLPWKGKRFMFTWPIDAKKGKYRSRRYELAPGDMNYVRSAVARYIPEKQSTDHELDSEEMHEQ